MWKHTHALSRENLPAHEVVHTLYLLTPTRLPRNTRSQSISPPLLWRWASWQPSTRSLQARGLPCTLEYLPGQAR